MSLTETGDRLFLIESLEGNLFPKTEKELLLPLSIRSSNPIEELTVSGSIYARALEVEEGNVVVHGPIASRGDVIVKGTKGRFQAQAGITTLSGCIIGKKTTSHEQLTNGTNDCRAIIRGDIVSNQNVLINNTIVFGSINAVNCTIINSIVLGTIYCSDSLVIEMSSLGAYSASDVTFSGSCMLLQALGESSSKPQFLPYEDINNFYIPPSVFFYPAIRTQTGLRLKPQDGNPSEIGILFPEIDWISVVAEPDPLAQEKAGGFMKPMQKWVLSLGGRIADITKLSSSLEAISDLLRIGFEFTHYREEVKKQVLENAKAILTPSEFDVLKSVCV